MQLAPCDFEYIRTLVYNGARIVLEPGKEYLVEARLSTLIRQEKLESISALVMLLKSSTLHALHGKVIEAMTTNETSFFRDVHPFEVLKKVVLPDLLAKRAATKTLSIWCGASSTGQEPYTIAMILAEMIPAIADWKINFIATDISSEMIRRSQEGKYNQIEVNRGLPAVAMVKHFEKVGLEWQIKKHLRSLIDFRIMNLVNPWPNMPPMDLVFLRNVLIYFDTETKKQILGKTRKLLQADGYLFLGCAETTMGLDEEFARVPLEKSGCYRHKKAVHKAA